MVVNTTKAREEVIAGLLRDLADLFGHAPAPTGEQEEADMDDEFASSQKDAGACPDCDGCGINIGTIDCETCGATGRLPAPPQEEPLPDLSYEAQLRRAEEGVAAEAPPEERGERYRVKHFPEVSWPAKWAVLASAGRCDAWCHYESTAKTFAAALNGEADGEAPSVAAHVVGKKREGGGRKEPLHFYLVGPRRETEAEALADLARWEGQQGGEPVAPSCAVFLAAVRTVVPCGEQRFEPERESVSGGCVANFNSGEQALTIWRRGDPQRGWYYDLSEFGIMGKRLALSNEPLFQAIAAEMHRLGWWVGSLRARLIDVDRAAARFEAAPPPAAPSATEPAALLEQAFGMPFSDAEAEMLRLYAVSCRSAAPAVPDERLREAAKAMFRMDLRNHEGVCAGCGVTRAQPHHDECPWVCLRAALDAAPVAAPPDVATWQPFVEAPKDGTEVVVWRPDAGVFTAIWREGVDADGEPDGEPTWFSGDGVDDLSDDLPTHYLAIGAPVPVAAPPVEPAKLYEDCNACGGGGCPLCRGAAPPGEPAPPPGPPHGSRDAMAWARSFVEHARAYPGLPTDEGGMVGWFANAMSAAVETEGPTPGTVDAYIHVPGDPSVGINGATVEVRGLSGFDDDEQREDARRHLETVFEEIEGQGPPSVQFSDDPPEPEWKAEESASSTTPPSAVAPPPEGEQPFRVQPEVGTGNSWSVMAWTGRALSRDLSLEKAESDAAFLNRLWSARPSAQPPAVGELSDQLLTWIGRSNMLEGAVRWALGERGAFRLREEGEGAYWWRTELRRRMERALEAGPSAPPPAMSEEVREAIDELVESLRSWREAWRAGEEKWRRMDEDDDPDLPAEGRTLLTWEWRAIARAYDELIAALDRAGQGGEAQR